MIYSLIIRITSVSAVRVINSFRLNRTDPVAHAKHYTQFKKYF